MGKLNGLAILILIAILAILPKLLTNPYHISLMIFVGIYCLITLGLSLLMGYAGQISLGHAAFYGIGAYATGILTTKWGLPVEWAMVLAVLIAAGLALIVGIPALRLRGHYLGMATLAFGVIVYVFFEAAVDFTGGPTGLAGIPFLKVGRFQFDSDLKFYYGVWVLVVLVLILALNIVHSRIGRALRSIHSAETATSAMGVDASKYKIQVFVLSACTASLAGGLYAHYMMYISPTSFGFRFSITLVTMVAMGGMSNLWGAMAGTCLLTILPETSSVFEDYFLLIYGGILIVIMMFVPQGFLVGLGQLIQRLYTGSKRQKRVTVG